MESKFCAYAHQASDERIREILDSAESFEESNEIPGRDKLTYSNGYYINCTALFIDIRDSSGLAAKHTRPVLGKIYRAYLSECVAVMNGDLNCREVFINGDCVSGIFNTPYKSNIDDVFSTAARLNSVTKILNWRLERKGYAAVDCGIGIAYGRALMLKAGYKGSGINDVIWMGDVVNEASNLCHEGNRGENEVLQVSTTVFNNLNEHNKGLLSPLYKSLFYSGPDQYQGNVINTEMEEYLDELKKKAEQAKLLGLYGLFIK